MRGIGVCGSYAYAGYVHENTVVTFTVFTHVCLTSWYHVLISYLLTFITFTSCVLEFALIVLMTSVNVTILEVVFVICWKPLKTCF